MTVEEFVRENYAKIPDDAYWSKWLEELLEEFAAIKVREALEKGTIATEIGPRWDIGKGVLL